MKDLDLEAHRAVNKIRITGWREGLNKVGMTKAIRTHLDSALAEAKSCTDQVLEGVEVVLDVPETGVARILARELDELGANVVLEVGLCSP